jgi:hypothetical protein|tara:strand:+ start:7304 stop:7819 length:516 start_codon:yes stop_codon:yes gene_type:complete
MKSKIKLTIVASLTVAMALLPSCGFYSFSGTSICAEVQTYSVDFFENNAPIVSPLLSQKITEDLKQKFISETNLSIEERGGDFHFSGAIVDYVVTPVAAQASENAQLNRLTIKVEVKLVCPKCPKSAFEQTFSNFQDFDATQDFNAVEEELIKEISQMLVQSIFNKAAINW